MILHNRNCAEVRISPSGMAPPADEDGTNDEADERPAPGSSDGDKPSVSPIGMASPADEDGSTEEADEWPVPGKIDGDKPSGKTKPEKMKPPGKKTKSAKRSKAKPSKKKKKVIIKKNRLAQDQHKTNDRMITHPHGKKLINNFRKNNRLFNEHFTLFVLPHVPPPFALIKQFSELEVTVGKRILPHPSSKLGKKGRCQCIPRGDAMLWINRQQRSDQLT